MKINYFFCIVILFTACLPVDKEVVKEPQKRLALNPIDTNPIQVSDVFVDFSYVKLMTPDGVYVGEPTKIISDNEIIYVLDNSRTLNLTAFHKDGSFKYEISSFGRGPGEFVSPNDFDLIPDKSEIVIYDSVNLKVIFYDMSDGSYKYERPVDFLTKNIVTNHNGLVFFNNNLMDGKNNKNIVFTDFDACPYAWRMGIEERLNGVHYLLPTTFTKFDQRIFLTVPFTDVIYELIDDNVIPYINIDFGSSSLPDNFFSSQNNGEIVYNERHKYSHNISSFFENEEILYFNYWYQSGLCRFIVDKKGVNETYHFCDSKLDRDIDYGSYLGWGIGVIDRKIIFYDQPYRLRQYFEKLKASMSDTSWDNYKLKNDKILNFSKTITSDDNPYLIFAEVRR